MSIIELGESVPALTPHVSLISCHLEADTFRLLRSGIENSEEHNTCSECVKYVGYSDMTVS